MAFPRAKVVTHFQVSHLNALLPIRGQNKGIGLGLPQSTTSGHQQKAVGEEATERILLQCSVEQGHVTG